MTEARHTRKEWRIKVEERRILQGQKQELMINRNVVLHRERRGVRKHFSTAHSEVFKNVFDMAAESKRNLQCGEETKEMERFFLFYLKNRRKKKNFSKLGCVLFFCVVFFFSCQTQGQHVDSPAELTPRKRREKKTGGKSEREKLQGALCLDGMR